MSYSQFGYTYPASSQLLVGDGASPPVCGYDSRLLSAAFPAARLASSFGRLYSASPYEHSLYTTMPYDLKESRSAWMQQSSACYPYDPSGLAYTDRYCGSVDSVSRRKNATRETTNTLKAWLYEHRKNPYPTKGEKIMLAIITKMTLTQVSTWFANARRRLKKENKMTWEPRNKTSEGDDSPSPSPSRHPPQDDSADDTAEFLKQPTDTTKHSFSFDGGQQLSKSPSTLANESPFGPHLDCFRPRHCSEEDSGGGSESPGPTSRRNFFTSKSDEKDFSSQPPPKIWSLARTATSDSPPTIRKPFLQVEFEDYGPSDNIRSNCQSMFCVDVDRTQQLTYGKEADGPNRQLLCLEDGRKVDVLKQHQLSNSFCKVNNCAEGGLKVDCEIKQTHQVPFYVEEGGRKVDGLKQHQLSFCMDRKVDDCAEGGLKVDCEAHQAPFYVEEGGRKADHQLSTNKLQVPFCALDDQKGTNSDVKQISGCPTVFCPETVQKQTGAYRDFGRTSDGYGDRTSVAKDPCLFAKCEESACLGGADRGSCMLQPYAPDFVVSSGVAEAYSRGRTPLVDAYAPGGSRSDYFVTDRFDQTMLGNKGSREGDETH